MRASKEHYTYGVRLFAESQNGGSGDWPLCVQHHPFLGDSLWSWRLGRAPHWHLYKRVDQIVEFNRKALQTFLYFPEERTNRRGDIHALFFYLLHPSFYGFKSEKSRILKPTSRTHVQSSHCNLHCSTSNPWALLLKECSCHNLPQGLAWSSYCSQAGSQPSFSHQGRAEHSHVCFEESQGRTARVHFTEQERRRWLWLYLFLVTLTSHGLTRVCARLLDSICDLTERDVLLNPLRSS